jgi:membrane associated rhomboid family serine protease
MFDSIWQEVKREFNYGNMVTRIIIVNLAIFVSFALLWLCSFLIGKGEIGIYYSEWLGFSSNWRIAVWKPWTPLTCMFLHLDFFHILWNMLALFWFGRIVGDLVGDNKILPLYLLGGLGGSLMYFAGVNMYDGPFAPEHIALGASGAVSAVMVAAGFLAPDYEMNLLLIGRVKLKFVVAAVLILFILGLAGRENMGGQFAHLGGAFTGWFLVNQLRNGHDWSISVNRFFDRILRFFKSFKKSKNTRVAWKNPEPPRRESNATTRNIRPSQSFDQSVIDSILDKIKQNGYESLTAEEKETLFNASKK